MRKQAQGLALDDRGPGGRLQNHVSAQARASHGPRTSSTRVYQVRRETTRPGGERGGVMFLLALPRDVGEALHGKRFRFTLAPDGILVYTPEPSPEAEP